MSISSILRLPNTLDMGYQHSYNYELPNPATSNRQIIPLVPNFSQGSDPSGIIQPPHYHDQGTNNLSQPRLLRREQSKTSLPSKKKRRRRKSSSSSTRSTSSGSHKRSKKSKRSRHSHKERRRRSPLPSLRNQNLIMVDIKEFVLLHRFLRLKLRCNLWKQLT